MKLKTKASPEPSKNFLRVVIQLTDTPANRVKLADLAGLAHSKLLLAEERAIVKMETLYLVHITEPNLTEAIPVTPARRRKGGRK